MKKFKYLIFTFIILNLILGGIYLYTKNENIRNTIALATTIQPETFTELYFEDHLNLPSKIEVGKEYSFKFTIHNLENKDMNYQYEVYAESNGEKTLLDRNYVSINKGESETKQIEFAPSNKFRRTKIVVDLTNENQKIAFWIEGKETQ